MEATHPLKVVAVSPEPAPYRAPLFDHIAVRDEVDLVVAYAARTVAGRTWEVPLEHRAVFLRGRFVPGAARLLRHEYPVTPGIVPLLRRERPDCVVASGWSTFASQAAILWCLARGIPYVLVVESHDEDPRSSWRRAIKDAVVPRLVRNSAGALVTGTLARESMIRRGARPDRVRVFANTVDVAAFGERADLLARSRPELRRAFGLEPADVTVLCVARLAPEKGLDVLLRAVGAAADPRLVAVLVGDGPERASLQDLAHGLGVRVVFTGGLVWERTVEAYAACDVFALLSHSEPWGVVVNEAAACGLPLVLSERVGAAPDLLVDGENGFLVPVDDVDATAAALRRLADDPALRARFGARSREIAAGWGYEPSVDAFVAAVRDAVA